MYERMHVRTHARTDTSEGSAGLKEAADHGVVDAAAREAQDVRNQLPEPCKLYRRWHSCFTLTLTLLGLAVC